MVETKRFLLFDIPNSIRRLYSNKLHFYGWLMICVGIVCISNAAVATGLDGIKHYTVSRYVNTHWITNIFLITGASTVLVERLRIDFFLFASISLNLIALFVAVGACFFDFANLHSVIGLLKLQREEDEGGKWSPPISVSAMIAYSSIDAVCCLVAFATALSTSIEFRSISKRYFSNLHVDGFRSNWFLLVLGACLFAAGLCKHILWICEIRWQAVDLGESARYLFLNYTMDEPVWNCVYALTGLLCCWTARTGGRSAAYCALPLTALSAYPAVQYLWIDYRWMLTIQLSQVMIQVPKPEPILQANLAVAVLHLILIAATVAQLCRLFSKQQLPWTIRTPLDLHSDLRKCILMLGVLFIGAGAAFLLIDIVNVRASTFYRLFYPTEQKLPFFLVPAGTLCLILLRNHNAACYFLPCVFVLLLLVLHATAFQLFSYVYLAKKAYFGAHICDLFFYSKFACTAKVELVGAVAHFMESFLSVAVSALSAYGSFLFARLLSLYGLNQATDEQLTSEEKRTAKRHTNIIRWGLGAQLVLGVICLAVCVFVRDSSSSKNPNHHEDHPLFVIHGTIQRITYSLILVLLPLVQLSISADLHRYPMKNLAQMIISSVRLVDVLMQVDYRNVSAGGGGQGSAGGGAGSASSIAWTTITSVELVGVFLHFLNFAECGILLDLGFNRLPNFQEEELTEEGQQQRIHQEEGALQQQQQQQLEQREQLDEEYQIQPDDPSPHQTPQAVQGRLEFVLS